MQRKWEMCSDETTHTGREKQGPSAGAYTGANRKRRRPCGLTPPGRDAGGLPAPPTTSPGPRARSMPGGGQGGAPKLQAGARPASSGLRVPKQLEGRRVVCGALAACSSPWAVAPVLVGGGPGRPGGALRGNTAAARPMTCSVETRARPRPAPRC